MRRSEGFPSQIINIYGATKPDKELMKSKKRKKEIRISKKIATYEAALLEEENERIVRLELNKRKY